jgi:hypothetical protein
VGGWLLVEGVWTCEALGTDDLLHPERWVRSDGILSCPPIHRETLGSETPPWTANRPANFQDVMGESGLRLLLAEGLSLEEASRRAAEYGTDRLTSYVVGDWRTVLWQIRVRSEGGQGTLCQGLAVALGADQSPVPSAVTCWVRGGNALALACSDRDIRVLSRGPSGGRVSAIPDGTCPEMVSWLGALRSPRL